MTLLSFSLPELGVSDKTEDPKIANAFTQILAWANGEVDATNLAAGAVTTAKTTANAWVKATLEHSYTHPEGQEPAYRLSLDGSMVELKGTLRRQPNEAGVSVFTVPAGYRPTHGPCRAAVPWWDGTTFGFGFVQLESSGAVLVNNTNAYGWVVLDGVSFPLA